MTFFLYSPHGSANRINPMKFLLAMALTLVACRPSESSGKPARKLWDGRATGVGWNALAASRRTRSSLSGRSMSGASRSGSAGHADFHALRYTWNTFLQRNGIPQRFAMKLLRHSDIKLTSKVYTDETQLPIYDALKTLPRLMGGCTQIRAQISGAEGQNGSLAVATNGENQISEPADNEAASRDMTVPVALCRKPVREGFEPSVAFWTTAL